MVVTEHGAGLAYRNRSGRALMGVQTCKFTAKCLCGEVFSGEGTNYTRAAAKAFKARAKHLQEMLKKAPSSPLEG